MGLSVALLIGAVGCGNPSFFEVAVIVNNDTTVRLDCLTGIETCQVAVSGAASDAFTLGNSTCSGIKHAFQLGQFQYGTDKDSGNVNFHVDIFDGNLKKLGQGDATGAIKKEGRQPVMLHVVPDPVAFAPYCAP